MRAVRIALLPALLLVGQANALDLPGDKLSEVLITSNKRFVAMDEMVTPIFGEGDIEGAITVRIVIETANPTVGNALRDIQPRLRAVALTTTIEFARLNASGYMPVDVAILRQSLNRALKATDPRVLQVLIVRAGATA